MRILHWFRKDLRLDDNTALSEAARDGDIVPFYTSEPAILGREDMAATRVRFALDSLAALRDAIASHGGTLATAHGDAAVTVVSAARAANVDAVYWNEEYEPSLREIFLAPSFRPELHAMPGKPNPLLDLKVRHVGAGPLPLLHSPGAGDYVFLAPTRTNYALLGTWGAIPNLHFFWLLDAVSQNRPVPPAYVLAAATYAGAQIVAFLALGVLLFQRRDVG